METSQLLKDLSADVEQILGDLKELIKNDKTVLESRPSDKSWSIKECIEHLNLTAEIYIPQMEKVIEKAILEKQQPSAHLSPTFLGKMGVKYMRPLEDGTIPKPMKTFKTLDPQKSKLASTAYIENFIQYNERLIELLEKAQNVDLNKNKIKSAVGGFISFKLGDGMRFVIAHEQRHMLQMKRALATLQSKER